jgi:hypothetical protein
MIRREIFDVPGDCDYGRLSQGTGAFVMTRLPVGDHWSSPGLDPIDMSFAVKANFHF